MLNVGKLKAEAAALYYIAKVATGIEDYYLHAGEAPGMWLGREAPEIGLAGEVRADQLLALLHGIDPTTLQRLTATRREAERLMGYDLTFRAPKSVSLVHALGVGRVPGAVRSAHEVAVQVALAYLEREAAFTRRIVGGERRLVPGQGFLTAGFQHRTSRAGDPLLHTHVLVPNLVRGLDRRWGALDGRLLYRHAKAAGSLYQAQLRTELTQRLGVRWTPVRNGVAEIEGVPPQVISAFARRRREITAHMSARGETSARAAQVATLATRRGKDYGVSGEGLLPEWRRRAEALGFGPHELEATLDRSALTLRAAHMEVIAALLGPDGLTAHASSFTRRDVILALCDRLGAATPARDIEEVADRLLAHAEIVVLGENGAAAPAILAALRREDGRVLPGPDEQRFTTRELLALERQLVDSAAARRGCDAAVARPDAIEAAFAARPTLSHEQVAMCRAVLSSGDGVRVVRGHAGTGKTYALDACRAAWEASGFRVIGTALSARAAAELQAGSGIGSSTLHSLLGSLNVPSAPGGGHLSWARPPALELDARTVVVMDEAGMVGTRQLAYLLEHARKAGAGVVLVGDEAQLPEIDAGGTFRGLAARLGAVELTANRRQSEAWEREALRLLREGRAPEAIAAYEAHGRVVTGTSAEEVRARMVADWWEARRGSGSDGGAADVVMVAARRADVRELNARARELRIAAGELAGPELLTRGAPMAVGDEVMTRQNASRLGVRNGDRGVVIGVDLAAQAVTVRFDEERRDPRVMTLPSDYLAAGHVTHAYAFTAHAAQGMTVDRALVLGDDSVYREWGYVALSRGREENRLYVVAGDSSEEIRQALHDTSALGEPAVAQLVAALERSHAQHLALDNGPTIPAAACDEELTHVRVMAAPVGDGLYDRHAQAASPHAAYDQGPHLSL